MKMLNLLEFQKGAMTTLSTVSLLTVKSEMPKQTLLLLADRYYLSLFIAEMYELFRPGRPRILEDVSFRDSCRGLKLDHSEVPE